MNVPSALKWGGLVLPSVIAALVFGRAMHSCGAHSRDEQVAELSSRIAQSEHTVEVKDGLYATRLVEIKGLNSLLDSNRSETKSLSEQLRQSQSELLSTQEVAVRWKRAFEGKVTAAQTDSGPSPDAPGITRKRVDFTHDFGPISVSGHTLTDPPEGEVSVRQTRPLLLTVNVARDKGGKWTSLVTSSEPTMEVGVRLGGVDLGAIPRPSWYQRLWLDLMTSELGDPAAAAGVSYRGERFSIGFSCFASSASHGCGLAGGIRLVR